MMVLHHLPKSTHAGIDFSPLADTIANGAKAMKDKGVFVLGFSTPTQFKSYRIVNLSLRFTKKIIQSLHFQTYK